MNLSLFIEGNFWCRLSKFAIFGWNFKYSSCFLLLQYLYSNFMLGHTVSINHSQTLSVRAFVSCWKFLDYNLVIQVRATDTVSRWLSAYTKRLILPIPRQHFWISIYLFLIVPFRQQSMTIEMDFDIINFSFLMTISLGYTVYERRHEKSNKMSVCPANDSDQPGHPPSLIRVFAFCTKKAWVLSYPLSAQRRLWSDWADAQADLSLRWAHSHYVGFIMSRPIYTHLAAHSFC